MPGKGSGWKELKMGDLLVYIKLLKVCFVHSIALKGKILRYFVSIF